MQLSAVKKLVETNETNETNAGLYHTDIQAFTQLISLVSLDFSIKTTQHLNIHQYATRGKTYPNRMHPRQYKGAITTLRLPAPFFPSLSSVEFPTSMRSGVAFVTLDASFLRV